MKLTPELISLPARKFIGLQARFISAQSPLSNSMKVLPQLWQAFMGRIHELPSIEPGICYGLCDCPESLGEKEAQPDELLYMAAVPVASGARPPKGMVAWMSPAGEYVRFVHRGPIHQIGATMSFIYGSWFPASGFAHGKGPDLERCGERFGDGQSAESELEIFVPVSREQQ